jgi:hypothetical protein
MDYIIKFDKKSIRVNDKAIDKTIEDIILLERDNSLEIRTFISTLLNLTSSRP